MVGGGGFKASPQDNRVEIAYYTLPKFEGRGIATSAALELIDIARTAVSGILVTAQTLPVPNASNSILRSWGSHTQASRGMARLEMYGNGT